MVVTPGALERERPDSSGDEGHPAIEIDLAAQGVGGDGETVVGRGPRGHQAVDAAVALDDHLPAGSQVPVGQGEREVHGQDAGIIGGGRRGAERVIRRGADHGEGIVARLAVIDERLDVRQAHGGDRTCRVLNLERAAARRQGVETRLVSPGATTVS